MRSGPETYVALLRGINVGGKNKLAMKELARAFGEVGATDVRTYIQSGNVVFTAAPAVAARAPAAVSAILAARFGLAVPIVSRAARELSRAHDASPYLAAGVASDEVHFAFLADLPAPSRVAALDPQRSAGDRFEVRGREVHLHLPGGVGKSRITNAWLDAQLGTVSTLRNTKTVRALLEMAGQRS